MNWKLDGKTPVKCTAREWGEWMETAERVVARDTLDHVWVSTVFLGIDHSFGRGAPLLFETMVFPLEESRDLECERYTTWEEAEAGHRAIVARWRERDDPRLGFLVHCWENGDRRAAIETFWDLILSPKNDTKD